MGDGGGAVIFDSDDFHAVVKREAFRFEQVFRAGGQSQQ